MQAHHKLLVYHLESERVFSIFIDFTHVSLFAVLDLLADTFVLHLVEVGKEIHHLLEGLIIDGILRPQSLSPRIDDVRFDEDLHMVAQCGLGQCEISQNITSREFGTREHIYDAQPCLIR